MAGTALLLSLAPTGSDWFAPVCSLLWLVRTGLFTLSTLLPTLRRGDLVGGFPDFPSGTGLGFTSWRTKFINNLSTNCVQVAQIFYHLFSSFVCLFDFILYSPSIIFHLNREGSSWVKPVLSLDKCVLLKDHKAVMPMRLEPPAPQSWVKHSTTEPLRSPFSSFETVCIVRTAQTRAPTFLHIQVR